MRIRPNGEGINDIVARYIRRRCQAVLRPIDHRERHRGNEDTQTGREACGERGNVAGIARDDRQQVQLDRYAGECGHDGYKQPRAPDQAVAIEVLSQDQQRLDQEHHQPQQGADDVHMHPGTG